MQHCGLTIPNIVVCYMLCQFAYPLRVVACSWELLLKVWNRSNVWANNPQHFFCPNIGSCCIRLHTTANKDATTPNIVGLVRSLKDKTDVKMSLPWLQMSLVRIITQNKTIKPRLWFLKSPRYFFFDKLCFVFASLPLNGALPSVFLSSKVNIKQMSKAQTFNTTLFNFRQKTWQFCSSCGS